MEALSVEIHLKHLTIRCCVAYGCQENDQVDKKEAFWTYLDEEVQFADQSEAGFLLHFDVNLWAGKDVIPGDPRPQNRNGKLFSNFLARHPHLTVVNSLSVCEGLITRSRIRNGQSEESILDFFVICNRILPFLKKMVIDENKKYILTNYEQARKNGKATDSDHFTQYMDLDFQIESIKPEREEILNFKNKNGQQLFQQMSSESNEFSRCFENDKPLQEQIINWKKVLKSVCNRSFKKIRITHKNRVQGNDQISKLINERNILTKNSENEENKIKLEEINTEIACLEADENRKILFENFQFFSDNPEKINMSNMWKLLKKLCPKNINATPTAKKNHQGKIVSGPKEIKTLLAKEYKDRLRARPIRPDMITMRKRKNRIFKLKMSLAERRESLDRNMKDLDRALSKLKNNKCRPPQ